MKKRKKVFLWIAVVILALCLLTSLFMKSGIDASRIDLFLYKMSGASLFLIWLITLHQRNILFSMEDIQFNEKTNQPNQK